MYDGSLETLRQIEIEIEMDSCNQVQSILIQRPSRYLLLKTEISRLFFQIKTIFEVQMTYVLVCSVLTVGVESSFRE